MQVDIIRQERVAKVFRVGGLNLRTSVREVRLPHAFHDVGALQFATQKACTGASHSKVKTKKKHSAAEKDGKKRVIQYEGEISKERPLAFSWHYGLPTIATEQADPPCVG